MCGIVGYVGKREAAPLLLRGLERVEYRGYDSAGLVVLNGTLQRVRRVGKLGALKEAITGAPVEGAVGIAHTRWATHGRVTEENAHPHGDCFGKIAVVHNGVIENAAELRTELESRGHRFRSETDSEVLAHLVEDAFDGDIQAAVSAVVTRVSGALALVVASEHETDRLVAYRRRSPLMVGVGEGENFVGSDIPALGDACRTVIALEEDEMAVIRADEVRIVPREGEAGEKARSRFQITGEAALGRVPELDPHRPIMIQEIHQQPEALRALLSGWIDMDRGRIAPPTGADAVLPSVGGDKAPPRIWLIGCGTAYHAARAARWGFQQWCGAEVHAAIASEFRYFTPDVRPGDLCIIITQSGETADTLEAMQEAKRRGASTLAAVNQPVSTAARDADAALSIEAGREVAVASTKAYVNQVALLNLLAAHWGARHGTLIPRDEAALARAMRRLPEQVRMLLTAQEEHVRRLAHRWREHRDALFIGRGIDYDVAMEGQLKLKEVSYVHAESVPAGELKHGTLALVNDGFPVVAIATDRHVRKKMEGSIAEVRARGAEVLVLVPTGEGADSGAEPESPTGWEHTFHLPATRAELTPILSVIPLQLLAHYAGMARNLEVDRPRNLAKSVTVE